MFSGYLSRQPPPFGVIATPAQWEHRLVALQHFHLIVSTTSTTVGIAAIMLLVVLLACRELIRGYGGRRTRMVARVLTVPIVPLLLVVGIIIVQRLGALYPAAPTNQTTQSSAGPSLTPTRVRGMPAGDGSADAIVSIAAPRLHTVVVNPDTLRFDRRHVGAPDATASIRVVNVAATSLPIDAAITGADRRDFIERNTCGGAAGLGAYAACTITVTFAPRHGGTHRAALLISSATPTRPRSAPPSRLPLGPELRLRMLPPGVPSGGSARIALSYAAYALMDITVSYSGRGAVSFFDTMDDHGRLTIAVPVPRAIALRHGQATIRVTVRAVDGPRQTQATRTLTIVQGR